MPKLTEAVQTFIVQRIAVFDTPSKIAAAVKDEFGIDVTRQHVESYNPKRVGNKPARKWIALHDSTRKQFLEKMADVPSTHRAVRVLRLERMAVRLEERALEQKSPLLAAQLMDSAAKIYEQIAKEIGEKYTNVLKVGNVDPLRELAKQLGMEPEQLAEVLAQEELGDTSTASAEVTQ